MPITIIDNFQVNKLGPIDSRIIATNSSARNSIVYKYDGLKVFQTDNRTTYTWNASASNWDADSGLSTPVTGTGSSGFLTRWNGSSSIVNSIVFNSQTGTLGGNAVGLLGINTPSTGTLAPKEAFQVNAPYSGGEAPPFVVSKGSTTVVGENWYFSGGEQNFVSTRGSSILQFDNGNLGIKTRSASSPSTTYNKLRVTPTDLELSTYEGGSPQPGDVLASIVSRSLFYNNNLARIQFVADGSWGGGSYPTSIVFSGMSGTTVNRAMTVKPNGNVIIGTTSSNNLERLFIEGNLRVNDGLINLGQSSTPTFGRRSYISDQSEILRILRQTNHPIVFGTNNVDRVRIESTGELSPLNGLRTPASTNGYVGTSGNVISSTVSNTMLTYEEGVVNIGRFINLYSGIASPTNITFAGAGGAFTGNLKYVKVGTAVTVSGWMTLNWTAISSGTHGTRTVEFALPFSPSSSSQGGIGVHLVCPQWTVSPGSPYGGTLCLQSVSGNPSVIKYHKFGSATGDPTVTHFKSLNSGVCDINVTFTYISNA